MYPSLIPIIFIFFIIPISSSLNTDGFSLLALKAAITSDPRHILTSWSDSDSDPCNWVGIKCTRNRVTDVTLRNNSLSGYIPSEIGALVFLRRLSLSHNNFSKPIPASLFNATSLLFLDLSHNSLSGSVPDSIRTVKTLVHLDLSSNLLSGSLPDGLSELENLAGTLNLSYNGFSGEVPASYGRFPVIVSLDLRHNNLTGKIPELGSLLNQGPTAFAGNPNLCGFPLQIQCPMPENLSSNPENPRNFGNFENPNPSFVGGSRGSRGGVVVLVVSGVLMAVGAVVVSAWVIRRKRGSGEGKMGKEKLGVGGEVVGEGQNGKFVVVDEGFGLELEDLLRASAYVVGKSRSGIVYKVVAGRGSAAAVVAVRRLSEGDGGGLRLKEFESEVEAIARVRHPNVVRLRAYYYASDEKLLVSDFFRNGSLYNALHGGPSNDLPPLSWPARLKIAQDTARGLMHIHEFSPRKYIHGNIKSSKILLDEDLHPYISGFGLSRLVSGASKSTNPPSKKPIPNKMCVAPEARLFGSRVTQKCDVYSFGILLLEILTGRSPDFSPENDGKGLESLVRKVFREERPLSEIIDPGLMNQVYAKKQVLAMFHLGLSCTELDAELRPRMKVVAESLDRIKAQ